MREMLFGLETELAFSAVSQRPAPDTRQNALLQEFFALAHERLVSLPELPRGAGMFLSNGSRLYLDCGTHPELCTPECRSPAEVVQWQLGGERLLVQLAAEIEERHPETSVSLHRCNVDYSGSGSTWGCHESYQHGTSGTRMSRQLIPHLVTRLVFTGAGGFDNRAGQLRFLVSPRVPHILHEIGAGGSPERGIYHSKNEPLGAGGFSRLHLMCGESLSSQLSNYLKVGSTALVVRLIDAGLRPGDALAFQKPLDAMKRFASDPFCDARAELEDGRRLTAVEVQTAYLEAVEAQLDADFMPPWAPDVCRRWRRVLEQLAKEPESLSTSLDWAIKRALFEQHLSRANLSWGQLRREAGVGAQLCEVDTRFGELAERGLFHALDRAGALDHRIPELGSIEVAMHHPPGGRAGARGRAIARLASERRRYQCSWDAIFDSQEQRTLDLSDPFCTRPRWRSSHAGRVGESPAARALRRAERRIGAGIGHYNELQTEQALAEFAAVTRSASRRRDLERVVLGRFWSASTYQDLADLASAERVLAPALAIEGVSAEVRCRLWTRCALVRIEGPARRSRIDEAMEHARAAQAQSGSRAGRSRITFLEARLLGAYGQYAAALATMERAIREAASDSLHFGFGSHLHWLVDYALELSDLERARKAIEELRSIDSHYYRGIRLRCDESALALREGDARRALRLGMAAVALARDIPTHRCRLEACLALAQAARADGRPAVARDELDEIRGWWEVQVGDLRRSVRRVVEECEAARPAGAPPATLHA